MRDGAREPPEEMGQLAGKIITQNICVLEEHKITNEGRLYRRPSFQSVKEPLLSGNESRDSS